MSVTTTTPTPGADAVPPADLVSLTIDGIPVSVPKGTLVIRAAELVGIEIPRFCDHPLLDPVGACRQCLVEVEGQRKPLASCTTTVSDGMVVRSQHTSPVAEKAQRGNIEFLLINHPLDCPMCDKGGECPLQNQAMSNGAGESRFVDAKRTFPKPVAISAQVLLDRERCVSCARCTRFSDQIAGDPFITLVERGAAQQVGVYGKEPFESYFSGNTVQICPVGALTGASYRFRSRPFDLVSSPGVCEHCASGCAIRTDHRRGTVLRRMAGDDPEVNEEWNCDKGRWAFTYATEPDRLTVPVVRTDDGLVPTSWPDALDAAARGLTSAAEARGVGVLIGGRLTQEDAYAYGKFARVVLGTNDIDFRARPHSSEEAEFLASTVAGTGLGVTYDQLEHAPAVLLVGFEPEEESPIVFLRLRKAVRASGQRVFALAPYASRGLTKLSGTLVRTVPGTEASTLRDLAPPADVWADPAGSAADQPVAAALRARGALVLVGERLAGAPGALSAVLSLARETGARVAWVPRRAGERGALEAGALPELLPGGRPTTDADARVDVAAAWGVPSLPTRVGRDTAGILAAAAAGELDGLLVAGVDPDDLPDPELARAAFDRVGFLVSLEIRTSPVTRHADVVLPVATSMEKSGTYLDWEGRRRSFEAALPGVLTGRNPMSDARVLSLLAEEMGRPIGLLTADAVRAEMTELGPWEGARADPPQVPAGVGPVPEAGQAVLGTWRLLLDAGRLQDGEPYLAATSHPATARISPATAAEIGLDPGGTLLVADDRGSIELPVELTDMPDRVVWVPTATPGAEVRVRLVADAGDLVRISVGGER